MVSKVKGAGMPGLIKVLGRGGVKMIVADGV